MATRVVSGTLFRPDGTPWNGAPVKFRPVRDSYTLDPDATYPVRTIETVTNVEGEFSITLASGLSTEYQVEMPDGEKFFIVVADGSATTLELLRAAYDGANPAEIPTLDQMVVAFIEESAEFETMLEELVIAHGGQPLDSDLTAIAGLSPTNNDVIQRKSGAWTNRTLAQIRPEILDEGITPADNDVMQRKSGAWTNRTMAQLKTDLAIAWADITKNSANIISTLGWTPANIAGDSFTGLVRFLGGATTAATIEDYAAGGLPAYLQFKKSRSGTINSNTIVANGDYLGAIEFLGANGTSFTRGAMIAAQVSGTPGASNDMPGQLLFFTTPDGSGTALYRLLITPAGAVLASAALGGLGYGLGAGGAVTQATSKTTGVTLNTVSGQITMNAAALLAASEAKFTVTNSAVAATDVVIVNHGSGGTAGSYLVGVAAVAAGSFDIVVSNVSAGSLSEAIVLNFAVIKAVAS